MSVDIRDKHNQWSLAPLCMACNASAVYFFRIENSVGFRSVVVATKTLGHGKERTKSVHNRCYSFWLCCKTNVLSSLLESNTTQLWPSIALINVTMMEGHAPNSLTAVPQEGTHTEAAGVRGSRDEMFIYSLLSLCANLNCVETYD